LLNALRIEGEQREHEGGGRPRWLWVAAAVLIVALLSAAGWWFLGARPIVVQTATAIAPAAAGAAGAVLQATGYVTARRRATVSTQITGTLVQVLIEEGDHVKQGQVIARLEDSALRAALNATQANVHTAEAQVALAARAAHASRGRRAAPGRSRRERDGLVAGRGTGAHAGRNRSGPA